MLISRRFTLAAFVLIVIAASLAAISASAEPSPGASWMGIYFGKSKIGYAKFNTDRVEYEGRECYRMFSSINTRLLVLGMDVAQQIDSTIYVNDKNTPVYEVFTMSSAGHTTNVTAKFSRDEIVAELTAEGAETHKTIPIPPGSKVIGDTMFPSNNMKIKVGDRLVNKVFNPLTLSLDEVRTEVLREEQLEFGGSMNDYLVVKSATSMGDITCWQDRNGDVLKAIGPMGFTMIRETENVARSQTAPDGSAEYLTPSDLAANAAAPVSSDIADPRNVKYLKIRFSGIAEKSLAISDAVQKASITGSGPYTVEYELSAETGDASKSLTLPVSGENQADFLEESAYVQPKNEEISKLSTQIVGGEKNASKAVSLLRSWVNTNMRSKGDVGIVRSSLDVLHTKTGVCRDYAILYTALARSAGIPTKVVSGLVFWQGKFYYHAWAESYTGRWTPVDATLPTDFVDATHIKFAEGDATSMFSLARLMGVIKAEILKVE
ncbi:MAG TPA: transglutaminase domain-containing protein [Armatimonadota bacterium]